MQQEAVVRQGWGKAELCAEHADEDMVNVCKKRCGHSGCTTRPSYGNVGGKAELCAKHADEDMVDARKKRCGHRGCNARPSYSDVRGKAVVCPSHAQDGMVDLLDNNVLSSGRDIAGSTAVRVGSGDKRIGSRPPLRAGAGTPSGGGSRGGSKRARVVVEALVSATSVEAESDACQDSSHDRNLGPAAVKTEVGVLSKVDPTAKDRPEVAEDERAPPLGHGLASGPDASVKAEVVVSLPSKCKAAKGQLQIIPN